VKITDNLEIPWRDDRGEELYNTLTIKLFRKRIVVRK
jgi:hypothetical protein